MIVTLVYVHVKPEFVESFIEASKLNHENSIKERGNIRFDIIQLNEDPSAFIFYEVFEDEEAIANHKKTDHYLQWKSTVEPWMALPRKGIRYAALFPEKTEKW
jgi:autoinducer 2-degrading protein